MFCKQEGLQLCRGCWCDASAGQLLAKMAAMASSSCKAVADINSG